MHQTRNPRRSLSRTWQFLQSRRLSLILLVVVAAAMLLAVAIPQANVPADDYPGWQASNPVLSRVFDVLLLSQIYSSWWFYTATALLILNTC